MQEIKDGCSWVSQKIDALFAIYEWWKYLIYNVILQAVLEYAKNLRVVDPKGGDVQDATIVVASIVYTKKTNYRTRAIMK